MPKAKRVSKPMKLFLSRLEGLRCYENSWSAQCPAHDDEENSLSVAQGEDGRVLVHCFAGCAVPEIVVEMGLMLRDLFPARRRVIKRRGKGGRSRGTDN